MKIPLPKSKSEYPFYIFIYWMIVWAILILYSSLTIISSLTPDGKYIEKTECTQRKNTECVKYDRPYYVGVGTELKYTFIQIGVFSGLGAVFVGGILMLKARK